MNQASYDLARLAGQRADHPDPSQEPLPAHRRRAAVRDLLHQGPRPALTPTARRRPAASSTTDTKSVAHHRDSHHRNHRPGSPAAKGSLKTQDNSQSPSDQGSLASSAGLSPGSNESAGRVKSTKTKPGNRYLKGVLGIAAITAARSKNTYFSAKYRRIASRRGPMRALVAVEHAMVIAAFNMLTNGDFYRDPGPDYYTARQPARTRAPAISQLESLGYRVTLEPLANTA